VTETILPVPEQIDTQQLAQQLMERARAEGVDLVGPGGLLAGLTKTVLETALEAPHQAAGFGGVGCGHRGHPAR
jgi:putative transposase